ncbi:sporulation protein YpjB [Virgibacillus doumboii]|uniref:sporulation protein YpjB n=1 Tax=Virgibacillus doumboii TaxID=2697503 RepID=UPI0013DEC3C5|nr:sporulation protein YpjB [Virgibacillus doumboii]
MNFSSVGKHMIILIIGIYILLIIPVKTHAEGQSLLIGAKTNTEMAPFYWMVAIVGGCIAITLTYVSWRKYKGEKKKQINKDSNS